MLSSTSQLQMPQWCVGQKLDVSHTLWVHLFSCVLQWCVSGWMFISLWLPASCMERINLLVWGAENLPNIMVFIQVPRWCYFGNLISRVFYMYNVFTLLFVFNSPSFSTIAWQIESTTKTKCTGSSSRKQRITSLADYFGPNKDV